MAKKLTAFLTALIMALLLLPAAVYAENGSAAGGSEVVAAAKATETPTEEPDKGREITESIEYQAYEQIAGYIAERYFDDTYTAEDIMKLGLSEYLAENGDEALVAILKKAMQALDDYSDFFTSEEYREYNDDLNKTFYGLGIIMRQNGEYVEIEGFVEENGLAQQSGFMEGDRIVKVDGVSVVGNSITEVRNLIVGELGTTTQITVERDGVELEITGTRTAVNSSTVSGGVLEGNIGYVKIASFSTGTASEFEEVVEKLKSENVKNVILDLRNNPGGLVSAATKIASLIVPKGKIVDVKYRDSSMDYTYYSELENTPFNLLVLVNDKTASSAEILASAIQDSGAGKLLGEQTFGKAVIQSVYSLRNGMVFKLTIGQYITRNGNEIDHIGLTPDIEVSNYTKKIDTTEYAKFDFLTPVSVGGSGGNVIAAKERLSVMEYFIGNLGNDVFNTDLEDAIREFQRDNGLADSGALDIPTQIKLKQIFEMLETTVDVQMQEAYKRFGGNENNLYSN
ncbi:MAG: PDZ domain-containing protein [Clostridia bacterium]|nr:PDZ domain-containing protein [Clostridia bacterium]